MTFRHPFILIASVIASSAAITASVAAVSPPSVTPPTAACGFTRPSNDTCTQPHKFYNKYALSQENRHCRAYCQTTFAGNIAKIRACIADCPE